jgi:putative FmdB family regulatory protein
MPTYEYQCKNCGHELEEFQSMSEAPLIHCPKCGTESLVRVLGGGAGLIFKGTGFYLTDYRKTSSPPTPSTGGTPGTRKDETTGRAGEKKDGGPAGAGEKK